MTRQLKIALAAGGTGGHIFPAETLMEELLSRGHTPVLITDKRCQQYIGDKYPYGKMQFVIRASSMQQGLIGKFSTGIDIGIGFFQARKILQKFQPDIVVGFGGYPSFPTMIAARQLHIKMLIHEQNSILGKVNAYLAPHVHTIAASFSDMQNLQDEDASKVVVTGNPVRSSIRAIRNVPYPEISQESCLRILIMGGSQGARVFSDIVPEAINMLPTACKERIRIDQQCRKECLDDVRKSYAAMNVSADLAPFFKDVPARLAAAHLVISRAGASTIAELTTAGRPVILVPYPHATGNHQMHNANMLENNQGGWVMPQEAFTAKALSARIEAFLGLPSSLTKAAINAKELGHPDAVVKLADCVEELAEK